MLKNNNGTVLVVAVVAMMIMLIIGMICLQVYTNQNILDTYDQVKMRTFYSAEGAIEMLRGYIDKKINETLDPTGDVLSSGRGFLMAVTPYADASYDSAYNGSKPWDPFKKGTTVDYRVVPAPGQPTLLEGNFDGTIYPGIFASVTLNRLSKNRDYNRVTTSLSLPFILVAASASTTTVHNYPTSYDGLVNLDKYRPTYEIVAVASTTHKTALSTNVISTTLRYYFYTERSTSTVVIGGTDTTYTTHRKIFVGWRRD